MGRKSKDAKPDEVVKLSSSYATLMRIITVPLGIGCTCFAIYSSLGARNLEETLCICVFSLFGVGVLAGGLLIKDLYLGSDSLTCSSVLGKSRYPWSEVECIQIDTSQSDSSTTYMVSVIAGGNRIATLSVTSSSTAEAFVDQLRERATGAFFDDRRIGHVRAPQDRCDRDLVRTRALALLARAKRHLCLMCALVSLCGLGGIAACAWIATSSGNPLLFAAAIAPIACVAVLGTRFYRNWKRTQGSVSRILSHIDCGNR